MNRLFFDEPKGSKIFYEGWQIPAILGFIKFHARNFNLL
jgi:hypothetical protein